MTLVDHLFVLLLAVAMPIHSRRSWRQFLDLLASGKPLDRAYLYRSIVLLHLLMLVCVAVAWIVFDRPAALLGLAPPAGSGFLVSALVVLGIVAAMAVAVSRAKSANQEEARAALDALGELRFLMPRTAADYRGFSGVSVSAGIAEEIVYRGFLFWYLGEWLPVWLVVVVSSLIFGLGHSYQGVSGIVKVAAVGLVAGGLYLGSGSIWLPMLAHALFDMQQGALVRAYLRKADATAQQAPSRETAEDASET